MANILKSILLGIFTSFISERFLKKMILKLSILMLDYLLKKDLLKETRVDEEIMIFIIDELRRQDSNA